MTPSKPTILVLLTMLPHCGEYCPPVSPSPPRHLFPGNAHSNPRCHRFLSPLIMRSTFEGIHRRILITRALCGFVGCDQCRRAHVCHERPTSTLFYRRRQYKHVDCPCEHSIYDVQCKIVHSARPQDNIRIGREVGTAEGGREMYLYYLFVPLCTSPPTSVYPDHCRPRCIRATPLWTVNWTQGVKTVVRETP